MKTLHPDYGLTEETRREVLDTAEMLGVRSAALAHRVSMASVYNWRRWYATKETA